MKEWGAIKFTQIKFYYILNSNPKCSSKRVCRKSRAGVVSLLLPTTEDHKLDTTINSHWSKNGIYTLRLKEA